MELPYQTYERITGKKWTGGQSPEIQAEYQKYGITAPAASTEANLTLQKALLGQTQQTSTQQKEIISAPFQPKTDASTASTDELTKQVGNFLSKTDKVDSIDLGANLPKSGTSQDIFDLNKTYKDAFKAAGLDTVKTQFNDLQAKIDERKKQLNDAIGQINENPWLSEASRVGKARRLQELAQGEIDNLVSQQKNVKDLFDEGVKQADEIVQRTFQQATIEKQTRAEARAEEELKLKKQEAEKAKIERVGTPDTGVWERDSTTGLWKEVVRARKPVNEMTLTERLLAARNAAIASAAPRLEATTGKDGFINPTAFMDLMIKFSSTIGDPSPFIETFASRLSPQERLRLGVGKAEKENSTGERQP